MNNFSSILRNQIASQLRQLRVDKNLSISNIACDCDLSVNNIDAIERGEALSFKKYFCLIRYYRKKIHIQLID